MKILIVDDDAEFIDCLKLEFSRLNSHNTEVEVAMTGAQAIAKAKIFYPDIMLLDNMLADESSALEYINAADVYRELRREGLLGINVIILTYGPEVHNAHGLLKEGVKAVINKNELFSDLSGFENLFETMKKIIGRGRPPFG